MLNIGDTIGIIALSGDCDREKVNSAKLYLETLGYQVKLSANIYEKNRYLAGTDNNKINELHAFFADSNIKLILCARGGYGAIRLINKLDYDLINNNPKPLCGFSDVTALLLMIYKNTGITTYYSPMACTDFLPGMNTSDNINIQSNQELSYTQKKFFDVINNKIIELHSEKTYNLGYSEGILWGGNLSTIVSLCGTNFLPDKNFIFFAEDINEPVYKIDKMFQQLLNINQFVQYCSGIVFGSFSGIDNEVWLEEYFTELASFKKIPVIFNSKITHNNDKLTLPIGKNAIINNDKLIVKF